MLRDRACTLYTHVSEELLQQLDRNRPLIDESEPNPLCTAAIQ